jgi:hypothetical protein
MLGMCINRQNRWKCGLSEGPRPTREVLFRGLITCTLCSYVYEFLAKNKMTVWAHHPYLPDFTLWDYPIWHYRAPPWVKQNQRIHMPEFQTIHLQKCFESLYKVPTTPTWSYHINYTKSNFIHRKELR